MEDDRTDGPPRQLPLKEQNPDDEKPTEDTVDTPPETETDGRPSLFGGSGKKKTKTSSTSEGDERVPLSPSSFIEAPIDLKECYAMQSTPRGHFILVNNKHFLPSSGMENYPRNGTDVDGAAITELFQEMGFLVEAHSNLSVYEMRKVFKQAAHKDYSGVSCLTCCILSHGQEGVIYGTDGTIEIREITSFFHGTNLSGKPKLFFFQACQGSDYMDSVTPDEVMETDGPASEGNDITLPSEADFLYAYSTVPGYYSWRNSQRGSWFIQSICEVFRKHAHKMDVVRMLTRVNAIVSTKKSQTGQRASHHKRQISSIVTQLRKELYFFPMHGPLATYQGNY
ncbi:LOW QUALITY PROTEIN: caspase-3-like [Clytia hemisphaerica]|uniref:LOW QUALITY PROTEIN: caspase-3-like n=1 Tax=Clytia hemisphaerica TaxID=252671 RepID=UPI0034D730F0